MQCPAATPQPQGEWSIAVFDDPTPNAFALPGGKIGVHTGMLEVARIPDQLAAGMDQAEEHYRRARAAGRRPRCEEVTRRIDAELLDWFAARGEAVESLINAALRDYLEQRQRR